MVITNIGIQTIAGVVGSEVVQRPSFVAIGTGSSTVTVGDTTLLAETDRNAINTVDISVANNATFITDFSSTEISGTSMQEFGMFNAASAGSIINREVIEVIEFEGDRELQAQVTLRFSRT